MANWKKVIVSGSQAELAGITASNLGVFPQQSTEFNVVIANASGEFKTTGSNALAGSSQTLSAGEGIIITNDKISASLASDGGLTFNGSDEIAISSSVGTLTGNSFTGSFKGDGSGITGITGSKTNAALTLGLGLGTSVAGDDTFDGDTAITVSVSGSTDLTTNNAIVKWNTTDGKFAPTTITDDGTNVTTTTNLIVQGNATFGDASTDKVTVKGDLIVNGTASFTNQQSIQIADKFIALNSGSTGTAGGGIVIGNSGTQNGLGSLLGVSDNLGTGRFGIKSDFDYEETTFPSSLDAFMGLTSASATANPQTLTNTALEQNGNIYVSTGDSEIWIYA